MIYLDEGTLEYCHKILYGRKISLYTRYLSLTKLTWILICFMTLYYLIGVIFDISNSTDYIFTIIMGAVCCGAICIFFGLQAAKALLCRFRLIYKKQQGEVDRLRLGSTMVEEEQYFNIQVKSTTSVWHPTLGVMLSKVQGTYGEGEISFYCPPIKTRFTEIAALRLELDFAKAIILNT